MKEYEITITETLSQTVTVEAENEQQAKESYPTNGITAIISWMPSTSKEWSSV